MKKVVQVLGFLSTLCGVSYGFAPVNFLKSNDQFYRMYPPRSRKSSVSIESGRTSSSLNFDGRRRNLLAVYSDNQSVIPMLKNPTESINVLIVGKQLGQLAQAPTLKSDGLVSFSGTFQETDVTIFTGYGWRISKVPGKFALSLFVPSKTKKVTDVTFKDLTSGILESSMNLQAFIRNLKTNVKDLGGLDLDDWMDAGIGDVSASIEWNVSIKREKELVKNILMLVRLGLLIPTARQKDEDRVFSMPLGSDGAWGIPVGIGLELDFKRYCRAGFYADFLGLFDVTRARRLKTQLNQSNFLLLNKGNATKRHGLHWQAETFLQWYHAVRGLSFKLAHLLVKQHTDRLIARDDQFSNEIINTSKGLKGWHIHNIMMQATYDFSEQFGTSSISPSASLFYKFPLGGKAIIDNQTFGGQVGFGF